MLISVITLIRKRDIMEDKRKIKNQGWGLNTDLKT
jgi:hypothetical protein